MHARKLSESVSWLSITWENFRLLTFCIDVTNELKFYVYAVRQTYQIVHTRNCCVHTVLTCVLPPQTGPGLKSESSGRSKAAAATQEHVPSARRGSPCAAPLVSPPGRECGLGLWPIKSLLWAWTKSRHDFDPSAHLQGSRLRSISQMSLEIDEWVGLCR